MSIALITGSSGLIGSESARFFHDKGFEVVGLDNGMRRYFFGNDGSVDWNTQQLQRQLRRFRHSAIDIRSEADVTSVFARYGSAIRCVIHAAAQPSNDWAAREPLTDFGVNAVGTLHLLDATRRFSPDAAFIFTSTNKVYGDTPNRLPLIEGETRFELEEEHPFAEHGIDETMSIDNSLHSVFGASKVAADVMVQEYGRYFGLKTVAFRAGCLTGPSHAGAELHGFLSYLTKCAATERVYTIHGYGGKQVRDNIHCSDLVEAFWHFYMNPRRGAVYNIGGSRFSHCSVLEAINMVEEICGKPMCTRLSKEARLGDQQWWISDVRRFQADYPEWNYAYDLKRTIGELLDAQRKPRSTRRSPRGAKHRRGSRARQQSRFGSSTL